MVRYVPLAPGTAPRTSMIPSFSSTFTILRFFTVQFLFPMCPAIRLPLKTREGKEEAPIEPGAR